MSGQKSPKATGGEGFRFPSPPDPHTLKRPISSSQTQQADGICEANPGGPHRCSSSPHKAIRLCGGPNGLRSPPIGCTPRGTATGGDEGRGTKEKRTLSVYYDQAGAVCKPHQSSLYTQTPAGVGCCTTKCVPRRYQAPKPQLCEKAFSLAGDTVSFAPKKLQRKANVPVAHL